MAMVVTSALSAFQWPAYSAATTLLVPKKHYGRAAGMVQTGEAIGQIISPAVGGVLLAVMSLQGIFLISFGAFVFSIATLLSVTFPPLIRYGDITVEKKSLWREVAVGWSYVTTRPGLLALLIFFAAANFLGGFILVLTTPLVLSFASPAVLGAVMSIGSAGMLIGGMLMSAWGGPRRRVLGVLGFQVLTAACFVLAGLRPSPELITVAAFFFFFSLPFINGSSQAIWQSKIAPELQGRVFAVRRMIAWSAVPISYLVAGPLADYVFEPLMATGGLLCGTVGALIGTGPGRGIGLLFIVAGMLTFLLCAGGYWYPRLRFVEDEIGDAVPDSGVRTASVGSAAPGPS
jgi:hypothetical protein